MIEPLSFIFTSCTMCTPDIMYEKYYYYKYDIQLELNSCIYIKYKEIRRESTIGYFIIQYYFKYGLACHFPESYLPYLCMFTHLYTTHIHTQNYIHICRILQGCRNRSAIELFKGINVFGFIYQAYTISNIVYILYPSYILYTLELPK